MDITLRMLTAKLRHEEIELKLMNEKWHSDVISDSTYYTKQGRVAMLKELITKIEPKLNVKKSVNKYKSKTKTVLK